MAPPPPPPSSDPYETLKVPHTATNEEISKSFKKLSLKYHPDKYRHLDLSPSEIESYQQKFHDIKEAKSFLLDPENRDAREKYDTSLRSKIARMEEDAKRTKTMSESRRRMREALSKKVMEETKKKRRRQQQRGVVEEDDDDDDLERLRKEGNSMKERYESKMNERRRRKAAADDDNNTVAERQVRLKWSRRKLKTSHSEDSIAKLMKEFGTVMSVELIGGKGNAALVTFADAKSCGVCVDYYWNSDEMRANFLGKRRRVREEEDDDDDDDGVVLDDAVRDEGGYYTKEAEKERDLRRAAERERLLRQMEREEEEEEGDEGRYAERGSITWGRKDAEKKRLKIDALYPPNMPKEVDDVGLTPLQRLERFEKMVFEAIKNVS